MERGQEMDYIRDHRKECVLAAVFITLALISFFLIGSFATKAENFSGTIKALDEKSDTVIALTGGATAASAAISLIPGDAGTPIADKLVDMSGYFLIILAAIYLEKWLLTITGMVAFRFLIPIALIGLAVNLFIPRQALRGLFLKLICFSLVLFMTVPASVVLSDMIDESYRESIDQTIENAENRSKSIQDEAGGESDANALEKIFNKVKGGVTQTIDEFRDILSDFVQAAAVLIVTSCVIPVAVMLFFIWLLRMIVGININIPDIKMSDQVKKLKGGNA